MTFHKKNTFINGIHSETCERDFKERNVESYIKDIIKSKVIDIYNSGILKPSDIFTILKNDYQSLDIKRVYYIIKEERVKKTKLEKEFNTFDIVALSQIYGYKDSRTPYVIAYEIDPIRVLIVQDQLLKDLWRSPNLHIDGTYKLTIYGFLIIIIIIGIYDLNRKFYCSAISISEFEDSKTFSWIIEKLFKDSEEFLVKKISLQITQSKFLQPLRIMTAGL
ncbi:hypothetical protein DMUE_3738 [Dictyocoela muelleri]|nr:hypothetical protein DMUE_3738 [Dictyocoela muelleri]